MAEKFDEFSKHLARKQTRRGALKFLGAGLISAFVGTVFSRSADADPRERDFKKFIFNSTLPKFNHTLPIFNETLPPIFNQILFNSTLPIGSPGRSIFRKIISFLRGN